MPDLAQLANRPADDGGVATQTHANAVVTLVAKAGYRWVILGYTMSTNANVVAAVTPDVVSGSLVIDRFEAPAGLPIDRLVEFPRAVKCPLNTSVVATLPDAGAAIKGTVVLRAFQIQE